MQTNNKGSLKRVNSSFNGSKNETKKEKPAKYPIFLSAAIYPGAGQIFQKRWLAGIFFTTAFTAMFLAFIIIMGSIIIEFYSLGLDFEHAEVNADTPLSTALSAFGITMLIYIINIIDTHAAYRRSLVANKKTAEQIIADNQ